MSDVRDFDGSLELRPAINVFDTFSEYAYAVKSLCDYLKVGQDDLITFPYIHALDTDEKQEHLRYKRRIPVYMHLPQSSLQ